MKIGLNVLLSLIIFFAFSVQSASAQQKPLITSENTGLSGRIFDQNGAMILDTKIRIFGSGKKEYFATPNDEGFYQVEIPKGIYSIEFSKNGFQTCRLKNYRIVAAMNLDIVLELKLEESLINIL